MKNHRLALLTSLLCATATWMGCSDDSGPTPPPGMPDAGSNDVRVTLFTRHLTESGLTRHPADFGSGPLEALIPEGESLVPITGALKEPGVYVFPEVPQGTYYLHYGNTYLVTNSRDLDLGINRLGRPDVVTLERGPAASLALEGLEPWVDSTFPSSGLQFISEQVGLAGAMYPAFADGATSGSAEDVSLSVAGAPVRFEQEKGDRAWVVQRQPRALAPLPDGSSREYTSAVRAFQLPPFSNDGSQPIRIQGTLQPVPTRELPLDWRISTFAAIAAEVHPTATHAFSDFRLSPIPFTQAEWIGYSGELLTFDHSNKAGDFNETLVYGNPYPANWGLVGEAISYFTVPLDIPGTTPFRRLARMSVRDQPSALTAGPIRPRVGSPRGLSVDGADAFTGLLITPGSHVIQWQPPASGSPNAYAVHVYQLRASPRGTLLSASFYMSGETTSIRLPAGILQSGAYYHLNVAAIVAPSYDAVNRPFVLTDTVSFGSAEAFSGVLTVQ
ncbi:hypothetical protein [Myxococcus eversor]|uniref:hypothetical protein n=1 Tax=Myxococcus eversor TaxID=2709661 RepID=UPI0013D8B4D7|nr:hypothetical protein [Myxococcus eversor]